MTNGVPGIWDKLRLPAKNTAPPYLLKLAHCASSQVRAYDSYALYKCITLEISPRDQYIVKYICKKFSCIFVWEWRCLK